MIIKEIIACCTTRNKLYFYRTPCMTLDDVALFEPGRRRLPAIFQPTLKKFVRCRMFVPDGDRRHCPKSGRIVYQEHVPISNDHVMSIFILGHYFCDDLGMDLIFRFNGRPGKNSLKRDVACNFVFKPFKIVG